MLDIPLAPPAAAAPSRSVAFSPADKPGSPSIAPPLDEPWWKCLVDRVAAVMLLVLTSPLIGLSMLLVKLTSPGPAIYAQTRLGKNGRPFTIYKIRSMANNCERQSGVRWSTPGDARVTRVGRFLRASHLDELPQLWNVLRGDMSLVGPRPERPEFVPQLERQIPRYRERLRVLPGLTGLAQVNLPPDTDIASVARKLQYDLHYLHQRSFWLDLRLIAVTAIHVTGIPFRWACGPARVPGCKQVEGIPCCNDHAKGAGDQTTATCQRTSVVPTVKP
jgi:lipopolysaccharide/colanic/teichoic acid biosynthesis glycosyltransferase